MISSAPLSKVCCPHDQSTEIERDVSYDENDPTSPHVPTSPVGHNTSSNMGNAHSNGLRPSQSSNSLRAVLESAYLEEKQQQLHGCMAEGPDTDYGSDSDIGSWILIPKNHMLVCRGDASSHKVEHTYLEPIVVRTSVVPLSCPLYNCARKRKASSIAQDSVHRLDGQVAHLTCSSDVTSDAVEVKRANLGTEETVHVEDESRLSATAVVGPNSTVFQCAYASPNVSSTVTGTPKVKPKIMKFTCQL